MSLSYFFHKSPFFSSCVVAVWLQTVEIVCVLLNSCCCCNTLENLIQHAQSFLDFFLYTRTRKEKKVVPLSLPYKRNTIKKTTTHAIPKNCWYIFSCLKMSLSIIQQNLQIYTDWIQQVSKVVGLPSPPRPSFPFRQSDQSDYFFSNLEV